MDFKLLVLGLDDVKGIVKLKLFFYMFLMFLLENLNLVCINNCDSIMKWSKFYLLLFISGFYYCMMYIWLLIG